MRRRRALALLTILEARASLPERGSLRDHAIERACVSATVAGKAARIRREAFEGEAMLVFAATRDTGTLRGSFGRLLIPWLRPPGEWRA